MCIHCSAGEHEDCNCEENNNEIRVLQEQIARLTAEVERHRMTEEERSLVADAAGHANYCYWAMAIRGYLDRTAPKEAGRE